MGSCDAHPSCRDALITICMTAATASAIKLTRRFLCLRTAPRPQTPDWGAGGVWEWAQQPRPGAALPSSTPTAHPELDTLGPPGHPNLGVPPTQNPPKWGTQDPPNGTPNPPQMRHPAAAGHRQPGTQSHADTPKPWSHPELGTPGPPHSHPKPFEATQNWALGGCLRVTPKLRGDPKTGHPNPRGYP